ncbi:MAG: DEAD/DEAH box helicase [Desulfobacterium sp.]
MNELDPLNPEFAALFNALKKTTPMIRNVDTPVAVFFRLDMDDKGFFLATVNNNGKEVNPAYEFYSGLERNILKEISRIKEQNAFRIEWGATETTEKFHINGNDHLISMLLETDLLQNAKGETLSPAQGTGQVKAVIQPVQRKKTVPANKKKEKSTKEKTTGDGNKSPEDRVMLASTIELWHDQNKIEPATPVTEYHMLSDHTIYRIKPLGQHFDKINLFETTFDSTLLEQYLTMLFSSLPHIDIVYDGYKVVKGEPGSTQPAVIFESVTPDNTLHLKVAATYPGYAPSFFDQFEMDQLATINEMEKKIIVSKLSHGDITACFKEIHTALKKHAKTLDKDKEIYVQDNFIIIESALASRFITCEISGLLTRYIVMGAEKLKAYKIRQVQPNLNVKLSHGIDFLEGEATLDLGGETFSLNDVLQQFKKNSYIKLGDGTSAIINPEYMAKLSRLFKKKESGVQISFFDLPIVEELIDEKVANKGLQKSRKIFLGFNEISRSKPRLPKINATLRSYQKQGFKWLSYLRKHGLGGCLADDMGLGKTIQTIALLASIYPKEEKPSLIVMPKTLLFNWASELEKFAPKLTFCQYHGTDRDLDNALKHQLILTTYAIIRNDIEVLKEKAFHLIVLDESQNIKNILSKTSKASVLLNADHRLALSGTPIENNISELYALFRFLNPSMFGSFADFNKNYLIPIQKHNSKPVTEELRRKIYPFILRRLKMEVLTDLPERMEQTLYVEMTGPQKELYHQRREMYRTAIREQIQTKGLKQSQFFIFQALNELRQIASIPEVKSDNVIISPKREILMEHVMDAVAGNHKVLVFGNYLHTLECVSQDMEGADIDHMVMTGSTRDRRSVVNRFQNDESCKALLMTLKTGGLGLNLTAAEYVFIFDPWWNLAAENQAIDRAHRMGQTNRVFSYRLIARDSIEEKILKLQEVKRELFDSLISSDSASIKQMDQKDVEFVLGG